MGGGVLGAAMFGGIFCIVMILYFYIKMTIAKNNGILVKGKLCNLKEKKYDTANNKLIHSFDFTFEYDGQVITKEFFDKLNTDNPKPTVTSGAELEMYWNKETDTITNYTYLRNRFTEACKGLALCLGIILVVILILFSTMA